MASVETTLTIGEDVVLKKHEAGLCAAVRGEVRLGKHDRMLYATDASIYQVEPLGVVIPADIEDACAAVRYCAEHGLPILPRGGGTSLAGQCVNRAVVIDFSANCRGVEPVDAAQRTCRAEPGLSIDDLNDAIRSTGLFFAPDPATSRQCNIGGAIGNNAAGTRSILYGRTAESLLGVDALLVSGERVRFDAGACARDPVARRLGQGVIGIVRRHERLIRERFPRTIRRNAGYALDMMLEDIDEADRAGRDPLESLNLAHLICGSEGTLAVTLGAELKLHPIPKAKGLAVLGFTSVDAAIAAVLPILALKPSAVELLDDLVIGLARQNAEYSKYVELMPQPDRGELMAVLYVEFFGASSDEITRKFGELKQIVAGVSSGIQGERPGAAYYTDAPSMANALKLRKAGEPLLHGIPGKRKPLGFVEDNAVPVEHLAEFVREFRAIVEKRGTRAAFWAHASVGVLHVRPLLDLRDERDRRAMEEIAVEVADLAKRLGGVMSGEHGDGRARGPLLERFFGPELMGAFREIKHLFDPRHLLNPGNMVEPGPIKSIHETTRVRPTGFDVHAEGIETFFDYSSEDGIDHAVELCNGSGVCRKKVGGTMCPSYMATLDERHSTRGRGNALRLAITGQLGRATTGRGSERTVVPQVTPGTAVIGQSTDACSGTGPFWGDPETLETLDLCLSCKACKTECPSNVDIAKYKAEYLAQTYRASSNIPLKARALGNVRALNRLGSMFAPIANALVNNPLLRALPNRVLGLAPRRSLPRYERSLYRLLGISATRGGDQTKPAPSAGRDAPTVVLYADCFTTYNEPAIGVAAARVLSACGYRVVMPRESNGCCGRAAVSMGLLEDARRTAAESARTLLETIEQWGASAVVVCEPSCLSAIKDEWRTLKLAVDQRSLDKLAAMSHLVEDFISKRWESHPVKPKFRALSGDIVLHGHCHQKALWGAETSAGLLRRMAGDNPGRVRVLDSGCCGMAGSFGYMADKYDLSMKIGELVLFPEARKLAPNDVLIAPGTSCRHQIKDGAARRALHPIEFAAYLLVGSSASDAASV
ncbi:MAG TPA: FAD-linked oxidase C-terminal domain-containing protein [Phycisphaerales bacterium]|nr:FAD-linked oxidase C-terminal domain-containing protein [Phycisphaerales bacterium]